MAESAASPAPPAPTPPPPAPTSPPPAPPPDIPPHPAARTRRAREIALRLGILAAAGIVLALFATRWDRWVGEAARQETDDAYIRGDVTPLSAQVDGYVRHVEVKDFQRVKQGDPLVEIEDDDYKARVAQAEAAVLGAAAAIDNIKARKAAQHAQVAEAESAINATQADVERTRLEATRQRSLLATTFGTAQKVEQAVADERRYAATLASNQAALDAQRRDEAVLDTQESELRADYKAKAAALDLAKINLGYTRIVAPVGGEVSERGVRDGQYVHAGTQVISVVPLDSVWVIANYKETQLTRVAVGQAAEIRVDTFPGILVHAHVDSIAPASGAQFSLLPPDNATGNFTKVVQRIPVKLTLDPDNPLRGKLRPGMSVVATILTDSQPTSPPNSEPDGKPAGR
ncbi:MAG TPA: HlyD family secretion protein [Stellaceae bacterium]|nr:HlyD family secretion protein [Stellaceae bacterium]